MFLPRLIPVLLLKGKGLVKTTKFSNPRYIGDPINAVKIFNDLKADELVFLDITASMEGRTISVELVREIGDEAFMPFGFGGGVDSIRIIEQILKAGAEKVIINTNAILKPGLIEEAAKIFGSQSIVVAMDVKKNLFGKYECWINDGKTNTNINPVEQSKKAENAGAGELIVNSMDNDGLMKGYDIKLINSVSTSVSIPVVASGGAGNITDLKKCYYDGKAHALAAGSLFVYHGARKAILINYPTKIELKGVFEPCN